MANPRDTRPAPQKHGTVPPADQNRTPSAYDDEQKDANEYDPVGMAGKKAGVLLEPDEEAEEMAPAKKEESDRKERTTEAVPRK